jgi:hypothetical protein
MKLFHFQGCGGEILIILLNFQGCEGEIESLIQESSCNIIENVMSVCRITGELALATDTRMVSLEVLQMDDSSTTDKVRL